ncbi:MAG: GNAT family N-acetyltransferase [Roseibium sp.]|uniref:GNAT family N-acetyltransferase n=1 Tax=Roseibium sp. TaxID=1936156 RepID=UPI00262E1765|nr:GNAT family N-acetyltransferase [Roseibium sp.]MCV0429209.1 GNAT family N-acetyltransferase [Roseibium sp.]
MKTTNNQPAIREAKLQDAMLLKDCIDRAYAPIREKLSDLPDVSAGVEEDIAKKTVLVAEYDGEIAGCAIFSIQEKKAHLVNIAVDPSFKGKGIGKALIAAMEATSKERGATEIRLATHVDLPENVSLYQHLGWHETLRTENKILMLKTL